MSEVLHKEWYQSVESFSTISAWQGLKLVRAVLTDLL